MVIGFVRNCVHYKELEHFKHYIIKVIVSVSPRGVIQHSDLFQGQGECCLENGKVQQRRTQRLITRS